MVRARAKHFPAGWAACGRFSQAAVFRRTASMKRQGSGSADTQPVLSAISAAVGYVHPRRDRGEREDGIRSASDACQFPCPVKGVWDYLEPVARIPPAEAFRSAQQAGARHG